MATSLTKGGGVIITGDPDDLNTIAADSTVRIDTLELRLTGAIQVGIR